MREEFRKKKIVVAIKVKFNSSSKSILWVRKQSKQYLSMTELEPSIGANEPYVVNPSGPLANLLNHIISPRYIANDVSDNLSTQEAALLTRMEEIICSEKSWVPLETEQLFRAFVRTYQSNGDVGEILNGLNSLEPGHTFAMYVREQKTVFMCHTPPNNVTMNNNGVDEVNQVIVATFAVQCVNAKDIYAHPLGSNVSIHIFSRLWCIYCNVILIDCSCFLFLIRYQVAYPSQALTVNYSKMLKENAKNVADQAANTNIEYKLDLNRFLLEHIQTKRHLLDVTSDSHRQIAGHLDRLERNEFEHIYIDGDKSVDENALIADIELVRVNLKFATSIDGEYIDLVSNEFSGMKVSLNQNCGSLFGLRKGLILEPIANSSNVKATKQQILLIPNGVVIADRTSNHVVVDVGTDLRSPSFHQYELDQTLGQIRSINGSYSSWFYLAYLHALTSHGEIEPLLEMSGTERALQILQMSKKSFFNSELSSFRQVQRISKLFFYPLLGLAWSSTPYDLITTRIRHAILMQAPI